ncbi:hypothetical protein BTA51_03830 [Hahella sp. CCB-MM4]|uniref:sensor histidine kinase n=1 Tax=Hahella sp. (strain CCB-MM4) TaxID=1926491 RepID=UPI000B9C1980|nr:HAMP domain-containing sensor histidine kinase [Hahella sp. CCB-MM4]OZG74160.1 hypothetical protein BTA51_03830 [Hahella sp. CCB-MM4]
MKDKSGIRSFIVSRFLVVLCLLFLLTIYFGRYLQDLSLDESTEYYMFTEAEWISSHYLPPLLPDSQPGLREYYWGENYLPDDVKAILRRESWSKDHVLLVEMPDQVIYLLPFESGYEETLFIIHRFATKQQFDEYSTIYSHLYIALYAFFGLAVAAGLWISYRLRQPISDLSVWVNRLRSESANVAPPPSASRFIETSNIASSLIESIHQLEEANRKEKDFLRVLSHELKTPLAITSGAIQLLDARQAISPEQQKYWDKLKNAQKTMQTLSQTILDLWRALPVTDTQPVDVTELLEQVIEDNRYLQKPSVEVCLQAKEHIKIPVSPSLLKLVLNNLVRNALQYTAEGEIVIQITGTPAKITIANPCLTQNTEIHTLHTTDNIQTTSPVQPTSNMQTKDYQQTKGYQQTKDYGYGVGLFLVEKVCEQMHWSFCTRQESERFSVVIEFSAEIQAFR